MRDLRAVEKDTAGATDHPERRGRLRRRRNRCESRARRRFNLPHTVDDMCRIFHKIRGIENAPVFKEINEAADAIAFGRRLARAANQQPPPATDRFKALTEAARRFNHRRSRPKISQSECMEQNAFSMSCLTTRVMIGIMRELAIGALRNLQTLWMVNITFRPLRRFQVMGHTDGGRRAAQLPVVAHDLSLLLPPHSPAITS
jgi:hypothetical protein